MADELDNATSELPDEALDQASGGFFNGFGDKYETFYCNYCKRDTEHILISQRNVDSFTWRCTTSGCNQTVTTVEAQGPDY